MNKEYIYKHYSNDIYQGDLSNKVVSRFSISKEINTSGSSLDIEIQTDLDQKNITKTNDNLIDDDGNYVVDNQGNNIVSNIQYVFDDLPSLNDRIDVIEFSDDNPNGKVMFSGSVSKAVLSYKKSRYIVTALSYGHQLSNYLAKVLPVQVVAESSSQDSSITVDSHNQNPYPSGAQTIGISQIFQVGSDTELLKIVVPIENLNNVNFMAAAFLLFEGTPNNPGALLATVVRPLDNQTMTNTSFQIDQSITLTASTDYFFSILNINYDNGKNTQISFGTDSGANYADGELYSLEYEQDIGNTYTLQGDDLTFQIVSATGDTGNSFLSRDPSNILKESIKAFNASGGIPTYTSSSVANTNTIVSYTFKHVTYYEVLQKCVELAPSNWYWFVDPATNVIYFNKKRGSVDHTLVKGKHIDDINLSYSLEETVNKVEFSGGDTGSGNNLVDSGANTFSVDKYGNRLRIESDNRVKLESTSTTIIQSILNELSRPKFSTTISVPASKYDITSFQIGQNVSFANFNQLINSLVLQIYRIDYTPDEAVLTLEVLPPTQSKRIEDIRRNLNRQQTENNPDDTE